MNECDESNQSDDVNLIFFQYIHYKYNRPVYTHVKGFPGAKEDDIHWLLYTGRRWTYIGFNPREDNLTLASILMGTENYHGEFLM